MFTIKVTMLRFIIKKDKNTWSSILNSRSKFITFFAGMGGLGTSSSNPDFWFFVGGAIGGALIGLIIHLIYSFFKKYPPPF